VIEREIIYGERDREENMTERDREGVKGKNREM
jgi:hypothetical protein